MTESVPLGYTLFSVLAGPRPRTAPDQAALAELETVAAKLAGDGVTLRGLYDVTGMRAEADLMIDVRFLPNPFYDPEMRTLTGNDKKVADFVLDNSVTQEFMKAWFRLLDVVMPGYVAEGKTSLSVAIGCTGGQHRSVAIANSTAAYLTDRGYQVTISHRDLSKAVRS